MDELHLARSSLLRLKQSFAGVLHQSCDQFLDNTPLSVEVNIVDCRLTWQRAKSCGNRRRLQVREKSKCLPSAHLKLAKIFLMLIVFSARFLSKDGRLLSTILPPPPITTGQQSHTCCAHAYCPMYGLMYLLVNQEEIWVYYTKYAQ